MRRRNKLIAMGMVMTIGLCGCQKNPESSIVKNKNFDEMIENANNTENGYNDMNNIAENYEEYKTTISDKTMKVTINVDAKVDIPTTDKMSVFRIKQKEISQEFLDKLMSTLASDKTIYDGICMEIDTKSDIERKIEELKSIIAEQSEEEYKEEYQSYIDSLQKKYENAPDEVNWKDYKSDGKIKSVKEMYEKDKSNEFYSWEYELNSSDLFYGVTDGKDGNYISIYMQNNEAYGNMLRYRSSKNGHINTATVVSGGSNYGLWEAEKELSEVKLGMDVSIDDLFEYENEQVSISEEQARKTADQFIENMGLTDYQYYEGDLYCEIPAFNIENNEKVGYRKVYMLQYLRNIDGVFVNNQAGSKHTEGWSGDEYVKKDWPGESIEIYINDDGIVGFDYNVPVEIVDTVVDKSNMKGFSEVKDIFEKMAVTVNAREDDEVTINIDRVTLGYTRISEADSYDTGLFVPVWDFIGSKQDSYGVISTNTSILTINAIDGTVIDRELGY